MPRAPQSRNIASSSRQLANVSKSANRNALELMLSSGQYGNKLNTKYNLLNNLDLINNMGRMFSNKFQLTPGRNLKLNS